jgi:hypothetical protein
MLAMGRFSISAACISGVEPFDPTAVIADNSSGKLGSPYGIDLNLSGQVVAANAQSVVRVDPVSAQTTVISSGSNFSAPCGVAVCLTTVHCSWPTWLFPAKSFALIRRMGTKK